MRPLIDRIGHRARGSRGFRATAIEFRLALLLSAVALGTGVVLELVVSPERRQVHAVYDERVQETGRMLRGILDLRAQAAANHVKDYTFWDDFVAYTRHPDREWARINLAEGLGTFDLDAAWVLDENFALLSSINPRGDPALTPLPAPVARLRERLLQHAALHFFVETRAGLLELWTNSIVPSADAERRTPPTGYYIVGRNWTRERLAQVEDIGNGRAVLVAPADAANAAAGPRKAEITIAIPLLGLDGRPVNVLRFSTPFPVATRLRHAQWASLLLMIGGAMAAVLVAMAALSHWVGRPVEAIAGAIVKGGDPSLAAISRRGDQMGWLARLVEESARQRHELIQAREAAEAATRAKSTLLANASHELRTPMHGILSYARFGVRDASSAGREELQEYFRNIRDCGAGLLELLDDLLDMSRIEANRMRWDVEEVDLETLAQDAVDEFASHFVERHLTIDVDTAPGLPRIPADRTRLLRVMRNLLSNAAKFSPPGGHVWVTAAQHGDRVHVAVQDSGPGIPPAELEIIFEEFVQASRNSSRLGGTGLGLAISREIIVAHQGRIWAENPPGGGARLVFELPVSPAHPPGMEATISEIPAESPAS